MKRKHDIVTKEDMKTVWKIIFFSNVMLGLLTLFYLILL